MKLGKYKHYKGNFYEVTGVAMHSETLEESKIKLKRMDLQVEKYKHAVELFEKGATIYKISKELNIQWHTANNWIKTKKHLPVLLDQNLGDISNEI